MVCIYCGSKTRTTNSRPQKRLNQTWRRKTCTVCNAIFTTIEKPFLGTSISLIFENGDVMPFRREKLLESILVALGANFDRYEEASQLTDTITGRLLKNSQSGRIMHTDTKKLCIQVLKSYEKSAHLRYIANHGT